MELDEIPLEKKTTGEDQGASDPKSKVKTEEEEQPDHYSKLQAPAEDLYAEAYFGASPAKAEASMTDVLLWQHDSGGGGGEGPVARRREFTQDKKDEAKETLSSKLSVELERERGKQTEGNPGLYRAVCLCLALISFVLLLVVIFLSVKLQTGSADCSGRDAATCNYQQCRTLFPDTQPQACASMRCPDGWLEFSGSCFHLSTTRLTWDMSQRNCSARGGSLVVISTPGIQHFLAEQGMRLRYWIGLRRSESQWIWVNNKTLEKSYWFDYPTQGDCGLLVSSGPNEKNWKKEPCQASTYYICQL